MSDWEIIRLENADIAVDVVPEKGGDIVQITAFGTPLLFTSPWGLRARSSPPDAADSAARWLQMYPGGWQTIFPNGGAASEGHGFHGEACLIAYTYERDGDAITLRGALDEFTLTKRIELRDDCVEVAERVESGARAPLDVMWSHHPAFGAPFLSRDCIVETDATEFIADDERDTAAGDLQPGARSTWPQGRARDGSFVDLRRIPDKADRFGYLTGFTRGRASITNPLLNIRATLEWDTAVFPHAWCWLETNATQGEPWFGDAYVFAIEPASTFPGQGITAARAKGGTLIRFKPGDVKEARVCLRVSRL